jgi:nucleoside-diphosphate-sugar epimerase
VNLGNPREMTVRELAEAVNRITGNRGGIVALPERRGADDPQRRKPDISRAIRILGWEPADDLEDGLRRTIEDFRGRS